MRSSYKNSDICSFDVSKNRCQVLCHRTHWLSRNYIFDEVRVVRHLQTSRSFQRNKLLIFLGGKSIETPELLRLVLFYSVNLGQRSTGKLKYIKPISGQPSRDDYLNISIVTSPSIYRRLH